MGTVVSSEKGIPSCLLCGVNAVHERDNHRGDGRNQPVWPPAGTRDETEDLNKALGN